MRQSALCRGFSRKGAKAQRVTNQLSQSINPSVEQEITEQTEALHLYSHILVSLGAG
jgi:hypothetical protein